jgi:hypothetical protein
MGWHVPKLFACHGKPFYFKRCFQWSVLLEIEVIPVAVRRRLDGIIVAIYLLGTVTNQQ